VNESALAAAVFYCNLTGTANPEQYVPAFRAMFRNHTDEQVYNAIVECGENASIEDVRRRLESVRRLWLGRMRDCIEGRLSGSELARLGEEAMQESLEDADERELERMHRRMYQ